MGFQNSLQKKKGIFYARKNLEKFNTKKKHIGKSVGFFLLRHLDLSLAKCFL